jgi:hypothetical protein
MTTSSAPSKVSARSTSAPVKGFGEVDFRAVDRLDED